jgi:hypothetical protein
VKTAFPTEFPTGFQQEGLSAGAPEEILPPDLPIRSLYQVIDIMILLRLVYIAGSVTLTVPAFSLIGPNLSLPLPRKGVQSDPSVSL